MRPAKELVELLRSWQSRERGDDFEEIAQMLEEQGRQLEHYLLLVLDLEGQIDELEDKLNDAKYYQARHSLD